MKTRMVRAFYDAAAMHIERTIEIDVAPAILWTLLTETEQMKRRGRAASEDHSVDVLVGGEALDKAAAVIPGIRELQVARR